MDKRVKYSLKQKTRIVHLVLNGVEPCSSAARRLGCSRYVVREWVSRYQVQGVGGLSLRNGSYEGRFKVEVVHYMLKNGLSLMQTAGFFGIPNISVVYRWRQTYERLGASGLLDKSRVGKNISMPAEKILQRKVLQTPMRQQKN